MTNQSKGKAKGLSKAEVAAPLLEFIKEVGAVELSLHLDRVWRAALYEREQSVEMDLVNALFFTDELLNLVAMQVVNEA